LSREPKEFVNRAAVVSFSLCERLALLVCFGLLDGMGQANVDLEYSMIAPGFRNTMENI